MQPDNTYPQFPQVDRMSNADARNFLQGTLVAWQGLPAPRGLYRCDLTDGTWWPWHLYAMSSPWHRSLGGEAIQTFGYAWHDAKQRPVFWGTTRDAAFVVDPQLRKTTFGWGDTTSQL